jgi:D-proline reductase (dithiol) PrdB
MDAPTDDLPVRYIDRTHAWYDALGTNNHYRYAFHREVPFTSVQVPLSRCTIALITTAAPYRSDRGEQGAGAPYNASAKFYEVYSGDSALEHDLRVSHVAVNQRELVDDPACWFPLPALRRARAAGRIGAIAARFHGMPTNRSQRHTTTVDCPELLARCREDRVDCAILVANCPVCHQTLALAARHLEAAGIATVLMGAAKDIVESCGVPRFVFSDVPLGNAAARPHDPVSQDTTMALALGLLERAFAPRTTVQNPLRWNGRPDWKAHVLDVASLTPERLERLRAELENSRSIAHAVRDRSLAAAPDAAAPGQAADRP